MATTMHADVAIIGGTGIGERLAAYPGTALHVSTGDGLLRGRLVVIDGVRLFLVSRHSAGHRVPPHRVNYKAIARGMAAVGVRACLSTAAVGSLRRDWPAGTLAACSDFLDDTGRFPTLFDREVVHRDFTDPFGPAARAALLGAARELGENVEERAIYLCANGPRYETPAEIQLFATFHADVVGMTAASEAILLREANVEYGCLAIVTNLAAGISSEPLDHLEVVEEMQRSGDRAIRILLAAARRLAGAA